jgi:hypothetical protein
MRPIEIRGSQLIGLGRITKGKTSPALLFGVVAATVIALMVLIGVSGKNDASRVAQQNAVTSTSQN